MPLINGEAHKPFNQPTEEYTPTQVQTFRWGRGPCLGCNEKKENKRTLLFQVNALIEFGRNAGQKSGG